MNAWRLFLFPFVMWLSACANGPDAMSGTEQHNPLIASSYAAADRLMTPAAKQELLNKEKRVLVASWVDVNQVSRSSIFGKMMAEQLASRLVQQGIPVMEVKLRSSLFITEKGGEMLLSREIREISQQHNAEAVVVGTYADAGSSGVYVTVKLVRAVDGLVLSATNFMVDRKLVGSIINQ
jgi:TolB-like protein